MSQVSIITCRDEPVTRAQRSPISRLSGATYGRPHRNPYFVFESQPFDGLNKPMSRPTNDTPSCIRTRSGDATLNGGSVR